MHYIKSILRGLILCLLVSGCSSLQSSNTALNTPSVVAPPLPPVSDDPWQNQATQLKALPNRYLSASSAAPVDEALQRRFEQGLALSAQHKDAEARRLFLSLAEQYPQWSGSWLQLAMLQARQVGTEQAQPDAALELQYQYLNNAINANPDNYLAHNQLAMLQRQQGQFRQALMHYNLALDSWPAFAPARLNRAILNDLYLGNKKAALEDYYLYQALVEQAPRQIKGWIADIERQIKTREQAYNATSGTIKEDGQ